MHKSEKEIKIKKYINNYLEELKRHFDISDKTMRIILLKIYRESGCIFKINAIIKKHISMIKSFYIKK